MKRNQIWLPGIFFVFLIPNLLLPEPGKLDSGLCLKGEKVAFSCKTDDHDQLLSICLATDQKGGLAPIFRMGDGKEKSFQFPDQLPSNKNLFHYEFDLSAEHIREASYTGIRFVSGKKKYLFYRTIFDASPFEEGIQIESGEETRRILCMEPSTGEFQFIHKIFKK